MVLSKLFLFLGAGILAVCLVLSITTLQVLRNAISENDLIQENAYSLVGELNGCVRSLSELATPVIPVDREESEPVQEVSSPAKTIWCRAAGEYVGFYDSEGKLIKLTDLKLSALPPSMREEVQKGFSLSSWEEVLELLRDLAP